MRQYFSAHSENGELKFRFKKELDEYLAKNNNKDFHVYIERETGVRTLPQNNSLHLWLTMVADELNKAGYTVQLVLKEKVDLDWTLESVKELLWRPAQKALTKKKSTTQLDKVSEIDLVREHLIRHLGEKFGLELPDWPHEIQ